MEEDELWKKMMQIEMRQETVRRKKGVGGQNGGTAQLPVDHFTDSNAASGEAEEWQEWEGRREQRDTNKEREGQGEVYDMEAEKMEGGGR